MAKRKTVVLEEPDNEPTIEETIEQEKEVNRRLEIEEWLSEFQERFTDQPAKVLIEKFEDNEWSICRRYALSTFDHEIVRTEFGGGQYRATLIDDKGHYVKEGRTRFKFADPIIKPVAPAQPANPFDNPAVVMMIEAQKAASSQMLEITKSMIQSSATQPKSDMGQIITAMKGLQDLTPKDRPLDSFKDTLNMMKLVKEVTGDTDGKGGLLSEIRQFLEVYPTIKEQLSQIKPAAIAAPSPGAAPVGPPQITTPERAPSALDPLNQKIVALVPKYVDAGKKSLQVVEWGKNLLDDFELDILPLLLPAWKKQYGPLVRDEDDCYDILLRYAEDEKEVAKIFEAIPPLAPYRVWVSRVIEEAIKLAQADPQDSTDVITDAVTGNGKAVDI